MKEKKLQDAFISALLAVREHKNFDTFLYEECQKDNGHEWGKRFVVFTENSIIDLEDIYELAKFTEGVK